MSRAWSRSTRGSRSFPSRGPDKRAWPEWRLSPPRPCYKSAARPANFYPQPLFGPLVFTLRPVGRLSRFTIAASALMRIYHSASLSRTPMARRGSFGSALRLGSLVGLHFLKRAANLKLLQRPFNFIPLNSFIGQPISISICIENNFIAVILHKCNLSFFFCR